MRLLDTLVYRMLDRKARRLNASFSAASATPEKTQWRVLEKILRREARTDFGRDHAFREIRSVRDFRRQVPIAGYERMEPYIHRVMEGREKALFARQRVLMFAMTSGTSAARKFIPVTRKTVAAHRRGWLLWGLSAYQERAHLLFRHKINFTGDNDEFRTPDGVPCGSISGLTVKMQSPLVRRTYVLPLEANKMRDTVAKYYLAWRIGLLRDVGSWMSPNPSTHLALARLGDQMKESLIRDVRDGTISCPPDLPASVIRRLRRSLRANPDRARELERIVDRTGHLYPKDVWPNLGLVNCWLGGTLTAYLKFFPEYFGDVPRRDLGLIASEGRMTIPLADQTAAGALDLMGTFFEFVPVGEAMDGNPVALLPHELEEGEEYYIIMTTASGLYRYHIQDVVRCVGWYGRSPLITFLNKGRHVSNLTGEKLSEHQVVSSMEQVCDRMRLPLGSYALSPRFDDQTPYYGLMVESNELPHRDAGETLAEMLDRELRRANCEYDAKRESGRLDAVRVFLLRAGAWERFDRLRIACMGTSPEQYKRPRLFVDLHLADQIFETELESSFEPIPVNL